MTILYEKPAAVDTSPMPAIVPSDELQLEDRVPEYLKAPPVLAGFSLCLGLLFLIANYHALWHTDVWGHLSYGRYLWRTGVLPSTEPLMHLSAGVAFVDSVWLCQLLGFGMFNWAGAAGLQFAYAVFLTTSAGMLLWRMYARTRMAWLCLAGVGCVGWVNWQQLLIIRPQLAGLVCFILLLTILTRRTWSVWNWVIIPGIFVLWANLHGSFPMGLCLLAAYSGGRAGDILLKTRRLASVFRDDKTRRYFLLLELSAAVVLINPYGFGLYGEVLSFAAQPNLTDLVEWHPLHLRMSQGRAFAVVSILLIIVYRWTPRRVSVTEVFLLLGLALCALWSSRMILWWAPPAGYFLVLHSHAVLRRRQRRHQQQSRQRPEAEVPARAGKWSVVTIGLWWVFFAITPFASTVLHGNRPPIEKSVSEFTPLGVTEYLREHPPQGQIFNTFEWGDYLLWAGPDDLQIFVASHVHLVPRTVWKQYLQVINMVTGWEEILARYGVNTIVLDYRYRAGLIRRLKRNVDWKLAFEDDRGAVFERVEPIE